MEQKRATWSSRIGFILAAAGSAVGLGNIWKFPGKAYEGGGGTFLLIYVLMVILLGMPLMLTEFAVGRASQSNVVGAFRALGHKRFSFVGWIGVVGAFVIASYYSHVGGWVLRYVFGYLTDQSKIYGNPSGYFMELLGAHADGTTSFPWMAVLFAGIFAFLNLLILIRGVKGGIERFNKIGMPLLFVLLLVLLVRSVTLPGAGEGIRYLLSFNPDALSFKTLLSAMGQAFYSLSIGMAILITYGSYVPKSENMENNTVLICLMDTLVAITAGFIVVPAVFSTLGADQIGKGGGFAFISLAGVFQQLPAGGFFGFLFYLLLLFAALTSCVSLYEGIVAFFTEQFGWKRSFATIVICTVSFLGGCLYTCTQAAVHIPGIWFDLINGITFPSFCDFMEYFTDRLMIPLCALGCSIFVGWVWKPESVIREVEQEGVRFRCARLYRFLIRYAAPLAILVILIMSFVTGETLS